MNRNNLVLAVVVAVGLLNCMQLNAQQTKILTAEKHNEYGLVYRLPVTALEIKVSAIREVRKAGPYYKYAPKYLGTDNVVREDSEVWTIEKVTLTPYGIPDPDASYLMQLKAGATTFIGVADDGMLLSINCEPETEQKNEEPLPPLNDDIVSEDEYLQYVGEDFIIAQSSLKQAEMLAEEIMEIRDSKMSLTRGTSDVMPSDGRQLELMLNSLAHQEKALTAAFVGNISRERVERTFSFVPPESGKWILFRMSDFAGIVEPEDYRGEPVYLTVEVTDEGELPVDAKGESKKYPKDGVAYCIPGTAQITMSYMGKQLISKEINMSQFGVVFGLNPDLFTNKKEPSYAVFDPATGALREMGMVNKK